MFLRWVTGALLTTAVAGVATAEDLTFLTWDEYIDPAIVAQFEAETGATVKFVLFDTDEIRDSLMTTQGPAAFDLLMINGASIAGYVRRGWLAPIDKADMPNLAHLDASIANAFDQSETYGVPYFWGTLGIAYRSDLVTGSFNSWRDLIQPDESLRGRISMMGAGRDLILPALKTLGESVNFTDPSVVKAIESALQAQKPFVKTYLYVSLQPDSPLITGEVWVSLAYSGGAKLLQSYEPAITYVVPDEGTALWIDYLAIPSQSPRRQLAGQFIDFLSRPDVAKRNALWTKHATPNLDAAELLPEEFMADPVIYPGEAVLENTERYQPLPPRVKKAVNAALVRLLH